MTLLYGQMPCTGAYDDSQCSKGMRCWLQHYRDEHQFNALGEISGKFDAQVSTAGPTAPEVVSR